MQIYDKYSDVTNSLKKMERIIQKFALLKNNR